MSSQGWRPTEGVGYLFVLLCVGALLALGVGRPSRRRASDAERILKSRYAR